MHETTRALLQAEAAFIDAIRAQGFGMSSAEYGRLTDSTLSAARDWDRAGRPDLDPGDAAAVPARRVRDNLPRFVRYGD